MKLTDIVYGPWMLEPHMLDEIQGIYEAHTRREKIDLKAVEASLGRPLENEQRPYEVRNGTSIIPIQGVISKRMNLFTRISGGTSSELVRRDFQQALDDPYVDKLLLYVDSPGGSVDGMFELAEAIYQARGQKPIDAYTDGQMASAAYIIGSAADRRFISSEGTAVGSIGVVRKVTDSSQAEAMRGVKTTVLTAGKYKGVGHEMPMSQEHQDIMQAELDHIYTAAIDMVSRNLGLSAEQVVNDMAEGRVFMGSQAIKAGLADGKSTLDCLCSPAHSDSYQALASKLPTARAAGEAVGDQQALGPDQNNAALAGVARVKGATKMTTEELQAQFPESHQAILAQGMTAGATAERERIKAIQAIPAAGHKAIVEAAIADGTSTAGDAALAIMQKEQAVRTGKLAELIAESPAPVPAMEGVELTADQAEQSAAVSAMVQFAKEGGRA